MKRAIIAILSAVLLYGLFREFTLVKVLLILAGLASVFLVSRVPGRYILIMKYPLIILSLLATAGFLFYPPIHTMRAVEPVVIFLSFYAIAFYLISLGDKGKGLYKEGMALSILFLSSCFNFFLMGKPLIFLAMALATMLFLFVIGRGRLMAVIGVYTVGMIAYLLIKKTGIMGIGLKMGDIDRYILLAVTFILLMFSFTGFMKKPNTIKVLAFFGFVYIALDILLVLGLRLTAGLLYQPIVCLIIAAPLMGIMLKGEGERV
jgi:hypothetical protein